MNITWAKNARIILCPVLQVKGKPAYSKKALRPLSTDNSECNDSAQALGIHVMAQSLFQKLFPVKLHSNPES